MGNQVDHNLISTRFGFIENIENIENIESIENIENIEKVWATHWAVRPPLGKEAWMG